MIEPRDDLRALEGYHSPQLAVDVRLNTNESPYPPPPAFFDAWSRAVAAIPTHRYPDRTAAALRAAIAGSLATRAERVFAANGSNEVLQTLLLAYGGPARRALVFEPTYALHSHIARITSTPVVEAERRGDFRIDVQEAVATIARERPAVTFVCSPNNPTGTVEGRDAIEALLAAVAAVDGLLVVDEAYGEFAPWSALGLVDDTTPLVVVRTYSKVWSLAGVRLGYAVGPAPVVDELHKVVLPYHLSTTTQLAGTIALDFAGEMAVRVATLVEERERMARALALVRGLTVFPSGANFILFRVDAGDAHVVWEQLCDLGVLVRDFSRWPRVEGCLRVTVGTPDENDRFLGALRLVMGAGPGPVTTSGRAEGMQQ